MDHGLELNTSIRDQLMERWRRHNGKLEVYFRSRCKIIDFLSFVSEHVGPT